MSCSRGDESLHAAWLQRDTELLIWVEYLEDSLAALWARAEFELAIPWSAIRE